jgi:Tfp pilus assembly protein PilF
VAGLDRRAGCRERAPSAIPDERLKVFVRGADGVPIFEYVADPDHDVLARPTEAPTDFDWHSAYGLHLKGKEFVRQREYARAAEALQASCTRDPNYVPALTDLAALKYRAMDYQGAFDLARRALSVDTYDPAANYHYGLAAAALGRPFDARDGFEVATQSIEYRGAAWRQLARLALRERRYRDAAAYAGRAVEHDTLDVEPGGGASSTVRVQREQGVPARRTTTRSSTPRCVEGRQRNGVAKKRGQTPFSTGAETTVTVPPSLTMKISPPFTASPVGRCRPGTACAETRARVAGSIVSNVPYAALIAWSRPPLIVAPVT